MKKQVVISVCILFFSVHMFCAYLPDCSGTSDEDLPVRSLAELAYTQDREYLGEVVSYEIDGTDCSDWVDYVKLSLHAGVYRCEVCFREEELHEPEIPGSDPEEFDWQPPDTHSELWFFKLRWQPAVQAEKTARLSGISVIDKGNWEHIGGPGTTGVYTFSEREGVESLDITFLHNYSQVRYKISWKIPSFSLAGKTYRALEDQSCKENPGTSRYCELAFTEDQVKVTRYLATDPAGNREVESEETYAWTFWKGNSWMIFIQGWDRYAPLNVLHTRLMGISKVPGTKQRRTNRIWFEQIHPKKQPG